tara:strand:- start:550 stop:2034 length:1485 start_codon:yes stop_codon:yes gene_type:complete
MKPLGYTWLIPHFQLKTRPLRHSSFIGTRRALKERADGSVEELYVKRYDPGNGPLDHLVFALKYDGLDLDILRKVFGQISPKEVAEFVARTPTGKFARQIGFWFEMLTGQEVPLNEKLIGNYTPLLDPKRYVVASKPVRNARWRIANNAIGDQRFMPVIRRTEAIRAIEETDWKGIISEAVRPFPEDVLRRALSYLYFKETKSSFAIEREEPGSGRTERFVTLLHRAGSEDHPLSEDTLTHLQNAILDERYHEKGYRTSQNYVGETTVNFREIIHLIGSPPVLVRDVMEGLEGYFAASRSVHPILRAAAISFPFVFIHPFEDGNGRIHRYLIHDVMARGGIGGEGLILPVSAEILADMKAYDTCLERFSKPLLSVAEYELNTRQEMTVENPSEIEGFYRYPDVTPQAEYLANMVSQAITKSLPEEIGFLEKLDRARQAMREIVDMPDRKRESLLMRLHRNKGKIARRRREGEFKELTDEEVEQIEEAFLEAFEN